MSDLYEIFVDGELRVVIYDDEALARVIWGKMMASETLGRLSATQVLDKIKMARNGKFMRVRVFQRAQPPTDSFVNVYLD